VSQIHTRRYQAPACPTCGSVPLLDAPSDRHAWFCPACLGYFTTDLAPASRPGAGSSTHPPRDERRLAPDQAVGPSGDISTA
jgi:hypothetical protein